MKNEYRYVSDTRKCPLNEIMSYSGKHRQACNTKPDNLSNTLIGISRELSYCQHIELRHNSNYTLTCISKYIHTSVSTLTCQHRFSYSSIKGVLMPLLSFHKHADILLKPLTKIGDNITLETRSQHTKNIILSGFV